MYQQRRYKILVLPSYYPELVSTLSVQFSTILLSATNALLLFVLTTFVVAAPLDSKPKSDGPTPVPELTPLIDAAIDVAHGTWTKQQPVSRFCFPYIVI
jgi:hypothetical protein